MFHVIIENSVDWSEESLYSSAQSVETFTLSQVLVVDRARPHSYRGEFLPLVARVVVLGVEEAVKLKSCVKVLLAVFV